MEAIIKRTKGNPGNLGTGRIPLKSARAAAQSMTWGQKQKFIVAYVKHIGMRVRDGTAIKMGRLRAVAAAITLLWACVSSINAAPAGANLSSNAIPEPKADATGSPVASDKIAYRQKGEIIAPAEQDNATGNQSAMTPVASSLVRIIPAAIAALLVFVVGREFIRASHVYKSVHDINRRNFVESFFDWWSIRRQKRARFHLPTDPNMRSLGEKISDQLFLLRRKLRVSNVTSDPNKLTLGEKLHDRYLLIKRKLRARSSLPDPNKLTLAERYHEWRLRRRLK